MDGKGIQKVACVGSGVIGTSWALNFAQKGYSVDVYDIGQPQLDAARETLEKNLRFLCENDLMTKAQAEETSARIAYTTVLADAVRGAQFIQESGPENYEIKARILAEIEATAAPDAVIATSTSGLLITEMAKGMKHPERLVGGHPYNPPHLIPLVEIVKGERSSDAAVQVAYDFYLALGKEPVVLNKEVAGFISNRLQVALYREAVDLVMNGVCSMDDIDKAVVFGPGLRWGVMGPNMLFHLAAGAAGLKEMLNRQVASTNLRLQDMAVWKDFPVSFIEGSDEGMKQVLANRPAEKGRTFEELVAYRDAMLIALLRLHGKL